MNFLTSTADGSNTLFNEAIGEHYHSANGALQESKHVFIAAGLEYAISLNPESEIKILEVGFGTGLNFLLSFAYSEENHIKLSYTGIEAFPLSKLVIEQTAYHHYVSSSVWEAFIKNYENCFRQTENLSLNCSLHILDTKLEEVEIYYDAFSVRNQPEMWSDEIIAHACNFLKPNGIFVSYAITGNLKRALKKCGFKIEKLPGAPGKREMIRAIKLP